MGQGPGINVRLNGLRRAFLNGIVAKPVTTPLQWKIEVNVIELEKVIRVNVQSLSPIPDPGESAPNTPKEQCPDLFHLSYLTLHRQKRTKG